MGVGACGGIECVALGSWYTPEPKTATTRHHTQKTPRANNVPSRCRRPGFARKIEPGFGCSATARTLAHQVASLVEGSGATPRPCQVNRAASLPGCVACLASAPPRRVPEQWDTKRRKTEVLPQWRRALTGQRADRHENDKDDRQQTCVEPHDDGPWPCQRCATKRSYCCRLTPWRSTSGRRGQYHCPTHHTPTPAHALSLTTACIVAPCPLHDGLGELSWVDRTLHQGPACTAVHTDTPCALMLQPTSLLSKLHHSYSVRHTQYQSRW